MDDKISNNSLQDEVEEPNRSGAHKKHTSVALCAIILWTALVCAVTVLVVQTEPTSNEESSDKDTTLVEQFEEHTNAVRSLVKKYTDTNMCGLTIFSESDFGEYYTNGLVEIMIAYNNLSPEIPREKNDNGLIGEYIDADYLNEKYKELFGKEKDLEFKEYELRKTGPSFTPIELHNDSYYRYSPYGAGCGGAYWITEYAGHSFKNGQLVVDMIFDKAMYDNDLDKNYYYITLTNGEKVKFPSSFHYSKDEHEAQEAAVPGLIKEYGTLLHHYEMVFSPEDDHYVLTSVAPKD